MFQNFFNGYIFCFLGHLFGGQLFELFARETNLKKQSSVLGGCKLMNSRGGPPIRGCMLMNSGGGPTILRPLLGTISVDQAVPIETDFRPIKAL